MAKPKRYKRRKSHHITGKDFEREILGFHEMQEFPLKRGDFTLEVCLINAVLAQPKNHDPYNPTDKWLVAIKNGVEKILESNILVYVCVDLPVDFLKSTDMFVVSMGHRSFVTVDLTTYPESDSKADAKFTPLDKIPERFTIFCTRLAGDLLKNTNRMTERMFQTILHNKLPEPAKSG